MADYKAFVSYSRSEDRQIAHRLQRGVERYAPPWYRIRALRLFLDTRSLSPGPGLWPSIEAAMQRSEWLVFLASSSAAGSYGVNRELEWWLREKSEKKLLIVDTDRVLRWDRERGDFADPTAVPPALSGALGEEPNLVEVPGASGDAAELSDDEFKQVVIDVAAPLRGMEKDDLMEREDRENRRRRRFVRGTIAVLSVLLLAAIGAGLLALHQGSVASARAKLALSRQIAAASEAATGTDLGAAMLLAVQAFRVDPNPQTRAALFHADTASPGLVRFLHADAKVTALIGSHRGGAVVAGLADGSVLLWPASGGRPRQLLKLSRGVVSLAVSEDGSVVAATDSAKGMIWRAGRRPASLPVPRGMHCDAVGLSPSGRTVVYAAVSSGATPATITVAPVDQPTGGETHPDPVGAHTIVVPSDQRALLAGPPSTAWENFSRWSQRSQPEPGFGAHTFAFATSADGRLLTNTNGASPVPIWRTNAKTSLDSEADAYAEVPLAQQQALAISPNGARLAVVGPGQIYVAPIVRVGKARARIQELQENPVTRPLSLTGQNPELVSFADDSHLLSANGKEIGVWNTGQLDRLAEAETVPLEFSCEECGPPELSISPNGKRVAVINGSSSFALVQSLSGGGRKVLPKSEIEYSYGSPVWRGGGGMLAFPIWPAAGGSTPSFPGPQMLPSFVRLWTVGASGERELTDGSSEGGRVAIVVDTEGDVFWQDAVTGVTLASSPGRHSAIGPEEDTSGAINPSGKLLALAQEGEVRVERLPGRRVISRFEVSGFPSLSFAGGHLLVQRSDGGIEVRDESGASLLRTLPGDGSSGWLAPSPTGNLLARSGSDGTVVLEELESGAKLVAFSTPGGSFFLKTGLAFTPDGKTLVSLTELSGEDDKGELVRRNVSDASLIRVACGAAGRDLSKEEWRALVGTDPPDDLHCASG